MKLRRIQEQTNPTPELTELGKVKPRDAFTFRDDNIDEVIDGEDDENAPELWMKTKSNGEKNDMVTIVSLKTGAINQRDSHHKVIIYPIEIHIGKCKMVLTE